MSEVSQTGFSLWRPKPHVLSKLTFSWANYREVDNLKLQKNLFSMIVILVL